MSYYSRLNKSFEGALRLPLTDHSKYVIFSDCHRGTGDTNDNFLKNQNLYFAALQHYYKEGYTYIELGDGDELWENRSLAQIIDAHSNVFCLLSHFYDRNRLYMLYGNHDIIKKNSRYTEKHHECCHSAESDFHCWEKRPLMKDMKFHEGIILENRTCHEIPDIYLTHGHQADLMNSTLWRVSCFLVRYLWKPLEHFGVLDPTSTAKNYTIKKKTERRLQHWAESEEHVLITGHTHRPVLSKEDDYYYNSGSCAHPRCITCLEIDRMQIRLIKWTLDTRPDMTLYVSREVMEGPKELGK